MREHSVLCFTIMGVSSLPASHGPKELHLTSRLEVAFINFVQLEPAFLEMESVLIIVGEVIAEAAGIRWLPH